jgi:hypothetical protein
MSKLQSIEKALEQWKADWPQAKQLWNPYVKLREPEWCLTSALAAEEGLTGSFAMIRLTDHRIVIDMQKIVEEGIVDFGLEILAHEVGHHFYTPANLRDNAGLLSRIRWALAGIEDRTPFVANLYADLLINDSLQRTKGLNMEGVYKQINKEGETSKVWAFYMRTYEYLWKLKKGTLARSSKLLTPELDADASLAASLIRSYSREWLDGAGRYAALMYPYLMEDKEYQKGRQSFILVLDAEQAGLGGGTLSGLVGIDPEELAGIVDPRTEATGQIGKGLAGYLPGKNDNGGEGPKQRYLNPGKYIDLLRQINPNANEQELINNYYREIALPHLVDFPSEESSPTSLSLPEGTESWDVGDPLDEIDWIETAITAPEVFPGFNTVKRVYGEDKDNDEVKVPLDVYIGIDCSGSMGNPRVRFSWPVLAATVIGLSALRAGAKVMGCLSGEPGSYMETKGFSISDKEVLTLLTSYLGTGYSFGVPRLKTPFNTPAKKKSHIVIVTDDDIFSMLDAKKDPKDTGEWESNWQIIERALKNAGGVGTLVLHSNGQWRQEEVKRLKNMGWHIYYVTNEQELLTFAAGFSKDHYHFKKRR